MKKNILLAFLLLFRCSHLQHVVTITMMLPQTCLWGK